MTSRAQAVNRYHQNLDAKKANPQVTTEYIEQLLAETLEALDDVRAMRRKLEEKKGNANND